jgi:aryl-alcohol dehydrogenase-like predicted oxidoreductase
MLYRKLGKTNMAVSVVGIGTWQFGGEWGKDFTQKEVDEMFDRGRELGINLVDTAECYGDHLSERFVGQAVKRDREKWIVATKFGHQFHGFQNRTQGYDPSDIRQQLEASLKALQTDYIDLYQFHSGKNDEFQTPGLWEMLAEQVKAGKVRHLGISVSPPDNIFQIERATSVGAEAVQVVYNRLERKPEAAVLPSCQKQHLGVLARVPLASGYLSGKYKPGMQFDKSDWRSKADPKRHEERLREAQRIAETEVPKGTDMAQWALAWCLRHDAVACVIPGCKNVQQVESNAAGAELARKDHPLAAPRPN